MDGAVSLGGSGSGDSKSTVSGFCEGAKLVDGKEMMNPVAEFFCYITGVVGKRFCGIPILPAPLVLQGLGQIPVVERSKWLDAGGHQFVGEPIVKIEAFRIRLTGSVGEDSGPRNGEAVSGLANAFHQLNIFLVTVVMIVGDIAGSIVSHVAGRVSEGVPDR